MKLYDYLIDVLNFLRIFDCIEECWTVTIFLIQLFFFFVTKMMETKRPVEFVIRKVNKGNLSE